MAEPPAFEKQRGVKRQLPASTGAKTAPGTQRELRFESSEDPGPEETDLRREGTQSGTEPLAGSAFEKSSEASEPFVLALETTLSDGTAGHVRHFAVALDGLVRPRDAEEQERAQIGRAHV